MSLQEMFLRLVYKEEAYPLSPEQIDKSIRQMRSVFGYFTMMYTLSFIFSVLIEVFLFEPLCFIPSAICFTFAAAFAAAFNGLGRKTAWGYKLARVGSMVLFLTLPPFARRYLRKLNRPEMRQIFNK